MFGRSRNVTRKMQFTPLDNYLKRAFKNAQNTYGNLTSESLPVFKEHMYETVILHLSRNEETTHSNVSVIPAINGYLAAMLNHQTLLKRNKDPKERYMNMIHAGLLNKYMEKPNVNSGRRGGKRSYSKRGTTRKRA